MFCKWTKWAEWRLKTVFVVVVVFLCLPFIHRQASCVLSLCQSKLPGLYLSIYPTNAASVFSSNLAYFSVWVPLRFQPFPFTNYLLIYWWYLWCPLVNVPFSIHLNTHLPHLHCSFLTYMSFLPPQSVKRTSLLVRMACANRSCGCVIASTTVETGATRHNAVCFAMLTCTLGDLNLI